MGVAESDRCESWCNRWEGVCMTGVRAYVTGERCCVYNKCESRCTNHYSSRHTTPVPPQHRFSTFHTRQFQSVAHRCNLRKKQLGFSSIEISKVCLGEFPVIPVRSVEVRSRTDAVQVPAAWNFTHTPETLPKKSTRKKKKYRTFVYNSFLEIQSKL